MLTSEKKIILCNKFIFDIIEKDRAEFEEGAVARRLREEYLEEKGRLRKTIAINYVGHNEFTTLRCKEHKSSITCICLSSEGNTLYSGSKDGSLVKCKFINFNFRYIIVKILKIMFYCSILPIIYLYFYEIN